MAEKRRRTCPCGTTLVHSQNGRPKTYCSAACRQRAYDARKRRAARGHRSEWWTPPSLLERVRAEHGPLGLDAAACEVSTAAPAWLGPTHPDKSRRDALAFTSWAPLCPEGQSVWCNPPYTPARVVRQFLLTCAATAADGVAVTALVPAATSTLWWHEAVVRTGGHVEYLVGRLRFAGPHADGAPAPFASALIHWPGLTA